MDKTLGLIIDEYWSDFQKNKTNNFVMNPSIPIIWFGDMEEYINSALKVVTVALNPSNIEFKPTKSEIKEGKTNSFLRFPMAESIHEKEQLGKEDKIILYDSLNSYFKIAPYTKWFRWFERSLSFLEKGVSYYSDIADNIAIHIDIYSALATFPTWGKLSNVQKDAITNIGLFKNLLSFLAPDIMIFSGNYSIFKKTFLPDNLKPLAEYCYKPGRASYSYKILLFRTNKSLIIFGSNVHGNPLQLREDFIKTAFNELRTNFFRGKEA